MHDGRRPEYKHTPEIRYLDLHDLRFLSFAAAAEPPLRFSSEPPSTAWNASTGIRVRPLHAVSRARVRGEEGIEGD